MKNKTYSIFVIVIFVFALLAFFVYNNHVIRFGIDSVNGFTAWYYVMTFSSFIYVQLFIPIALFFVIRSFRDNVSLNKLYKKTVWIVPGASFMVFMLSIMFYERGLGFVSRMYRNMYQEFYEGLESTPILYVIAVLFATGLVLAILVNL